MATVAVAGCSSFKTELGQSFPENRASLAEGQTRIETVLDEFGPPNLVSALPEGVAFLYEHSVIGEFQFGISFNLPVIRYFKFIKARNHLDQDAVLMTFDEQGVLQGIGSGAWEENLGGGTALQLIVMVVSLSNTSELRRRADAHAWGRWLLQPLPVALNSEQTLRTGANGLQQRIAPRYVGQQTLEMPKPQKAKEKKRPKRQY
jgi:hypothetical protein